MKMAFFLIIITLFPIFGFGQENVTLHNGKKIIIYPNKTWDYEADILKDTKKSNNENGNQKILIYSAYAHPPNAADGVDISIKWGYYDTFRDIKYIYFTVVPYNAVGDVQTCSITGNSSVRGKITGPIKAIYDETCQWETMWYNSTITCFKITKVEVQYMDGTSYIYVKELPNIFNTDFSNKCN